MNNLFVETILSDKICLSPLMIREGLKDSLLEKLVSKFENVCTYHGFIRRESIEIHKYSMGQVRTFSLNGDVVYNVMYKAQVCNPAIGSIMKAKIVNMNKFGFLAEALGVLEIIVPREDNLSSYQIGDEITICVQGKKFELGDLKISIVANIISNLHPYTHEQNSHDLNDDDTIEHINDDDKQNIYVQEEDSDDDEISDDNLSTDDDSSVSVSDSESSGIASVGDMGNDQRRDQGQIHETDNAVDLDDGVDDYTNKEDDEL